MQRAILILAFLVAGAASPVAALDSDAESSLRIAVFPMTSAIKEVPAVTLETAITDALVSESRYEVVARTQIDKVLAEQRLANSDLVDPKQAQAVGKLLGAQYVVTGVLLSASFEPGLFSKDEFRARAQLQVIEASTGRIALSETFTGVRKQLVMRRGATLGSLSPAERDKSLGESLGAIGHQFASRVSLLHPLAGYVVKVDGSRVAVKLGKSSGLKPGHELLVYEEAESIRDPVTGATLAADRTPVARLVVTSVGDAVSWARVAVTYSPKASAEIGGERVDRKPVAGVVREQMSFVQTEPRVAQIEAELRRQGRRTR